MISRNHRFHGPNALRFVYQNGRMARGPLFAVKSAVNPRRQTYRVAVVVSRKVHKSAVGRNRMRRRIYEQVRELEADILHPYDIVITVFHDTLLDTSPMELKKQIKRQLSEGGILAKRVQ